MQSVWESSTVKGYIRALIYIYKYGKSLMKFVVIKYLNIIYMSNMFLYNLEHLLGNIFKKKII